MKRLKRISEKKSLSKKGIAVSLVALGIVGVASIGGSAFATKSSKDGDLAERLAAKFSLNKKQVSAEIDANRSEQRTSRETETQQKLANRFQKLVDDEKLTNEQKSALLIKLEELHSKREESRKPNNGEDDKTSEEHKAERDAARTELKEWAKEQGINLDEVLPQTNSKKLGGGYMYDDRKGDETIE